MEQSRPVEAARLKRNKNCYRARLGIEISAGWSSPVARQAHNLKVVGSNPTPATKNQALARAGAFLCPVARQAQNLKAGAVKKTIEDRF